MTLLDWLFVLLVVGIAGIIAAKSGDLREVIRIVLS